MSLSIWVSRLKWILPGFALLFFIGFTIIWWADSSRGELPVLGNIPDFEMTEQNGTPFGRTDLNGRISVVDFIFTSCPGICPVLGAHMVELYEDFEGYDQIQFVSISVDPDRDSLSVLKEYARGWGVDDNRWVFLRAPIEDVVDLCETGFMLAADGLPGGHTTRFTLLDHRGQIRGYYDGMEQASVKIIKNHIRQLAEEMP